MGNGGKTSGSLKITMKKKKCQKVFPYIDYNICPTGQKLVTQKGKKKSTYNSEHYST